MKINQAALIALLIIAIIGTFAILYATYWGPWTFSDGVGYLSIARNFISGRGLGIYKPSGNFDPLRSHGPLHSIVVGLTSTITGNVISASRWVAAIAFGLLLFMVGWLFGSILRAPWIGVLLALILMITPQVVIAYTSAMAEPIFLLTALVSMLILVNYLSSNRLSLLLLSSTLMGVSILTRYPAIAFVVAGVACILLFEKTQIKQRVRDSMIFGAISIAPLIIFMSWSLLTYEGDAPKAITGELDLIGKIGRFFNQMLQVYWTWKPIGMEILDVGQQMLRTSPLPFLFLFLLVGLFCGFIVILHLRGKQRESIDPLANADLILLLRTLVIFQITFVVSFLAIFLISFPTPDIDPRTQLPLLPLLIMTVLAGYVYLVRVVNVSRWVAGVFAGLLLVGSLGYYIQSFDIYRGLHRTGLGYTSEAWRSSETLAAVARLPADSPWISNEPMPILLYYDRWPVEMEEINRTVPLDNPERFGDGDGNSELLFREQDGYLILFDSIHKQLEPLYGTGTDQRVFMLTDGLQQLFNGLDGGIFTYP